ncbi:NAD(P)-dependent oxidoreductase [Parasphingorhabdus sp.]|jgi:D-3-phosphoglycerate dehydrogenase|uniref:NAD(P)-dependent oxidoreductase n=1 Tax=Parasphingorhabdus sp. TaxID=2709688 RepID=UPI003001D4FE
MSERKNILVTCPPMLGLIEEFAGDFDAKGLDFTAAPVVQVMSEAELIDMLPAYDGWIIGDDPATADVLEAGAAGKLRAIVKWGVGVDNVDFDAANRLCLHSTNTPGVFGKEVADLAMNYVGALARQSFYIDREIRQNCSWPKPAGISLAGKKVGLIGFGDIGRNTARRMLSADMEVTVYDPFFEAVEGLHVTPAQWPTGLSKLDFLVFTAPLNNHTRHMFHRGLLDRVKPGVRIVNVGRGPVVEEQALIDGLQRGVIHSVGLDVFEVEPLPVDSPLRDYPYNVFGSHNGSNTIDAVERVSRMAIDIIAGFLQND